MSSKNKKLKILLSLTTAIIFLLLSVLISENHIVVKKYNYATDNSASCRIVFISDLHGRSFGENNSDLLGKITNLNPDLICLGGDFVNDEATDDEISEFISLLNKLIKIAPTYFSYGNHDLNYINANGDNISHLIEETGCVILEEEYVDLEINNKKIRLGGMFDYAFNQQYAPDEEWQNDTTYAFLVDFTSTDSTKILLCHRPDSFIYGNGALWNIDYVLSGHTHGGIWRFPVIGGVIAPEQGILPKYDKGEYDIGNIKLIISSGFDGYNKIPRLFNCPEITVIEF